MTREELEEQRADEFYDSWHVDRFMCPRCGRREANPIARLGVFECRECGWPARDRRNRAERAA